MTATSSGRSCHLALGYVVSALMVWVCVAGMTGCRSIYSQARVIYPAGVSARLKLRIEEADRASRRADQAVEILRERFGHGLGGRNVEPDVDRLELTALEFERCVAAVREAAADCEPPAQATAEVQRLEQRAKQLLAAAVALRKSGPNPTVTQLDKLLPDPGHP